MGLTKQDVRDVIDVYIQAWDHAGPGSDRDDLHARAPHTTKGLWPTRSQTGKRSGGTGKPRSSPSKPTSPAAWRASTSMATPR